MASTDFNNIPIPRSKITGDKLQVFFDLSKNRIGVTTADSTFLWSKSKGGETLATLPRNTKLSIYGAKDSRLYVVIAAGPNSLDVGFVDPESVQFESNSLVATDTQDIIPPSQILKGSKFNLLFKAGLIFGSPNAKDKIIFSGTEKEIPEATHEVYDTYKDKNGEYYLSLNSEPKSQKDGGYQKATMPDGTRVARLDKKKYGNGKWWKVKIVTTSGNGQEGYAHSKWLRKTGPQSGLEKGTPLTLVPAPKTNKDGTTNKADLRRRLRKKYIKVVIAGGPHRGIECYVNRSSVEPYKDQNIPDQISNYDFNFQEALQKLFNEIGKKRIKEITPQAQTAAEPAKKAVEVALGSNTPARHVPWSYPAAEISQANDLVIYQPFYFAEYRQNNDQDVQTFIAEIGQGSLVQTPVKNIADYFYQPHLIQRALFTSPLNIAPPETEVVFPPPTVENPDNTSDFDSEEFQLLSSLAYQNNLDTTTLAKILLAELPETREYIASKIAQFIGMDERFVSHLFEIEGQNASVSVVPSSIDAPQWGYFKYTFTQQQILNADKTTKKVKTGSGKKVKTKTVPWSDGLENYYGPLSIKGTNTLIGDIDKTAFGVATVHGYLKRTIERMVAGKEDKQLGNGVYGRTNFNEFETRLEEVESLFVRFSEDIDEDEKTIKIERSPNKQDPVKPTQEILNNLDKVAPYISKALAGDTNTTPVGLDEIDFSLAIGPEIEPSFASICFEPSPPGNITQNKPSYKLLTVVNQSPRGTEEFDLSYGKTTQIEKRYSDVLSSKFNFRISTQGAIINELENKPTGSNKSNFDYLFDKSATQSAYPQLLSYIALSIMSEAITNGTVEPPFDVPNPDVLRREVLCADGGEGGTKTVVNAFSSDGPLGPYVLGIIPGNLLNGYEDPGGTLSEPELSGSGENVVANFSSVKAQDMFGTFEGQPPAQLKPYRSNLPEDASASEELQNEAASTVKINEEISLRFIAPEAVLRDSFVPVDQVYQTSGHYQVLYYPKYENLANKFRWLEKVGEDEFRFNFEFLDIEVVTSSTDEFLQLLKKEEYDIISACLNEAQFQKVINSKTYEEFFNNVFKGKKEFNKSETPPSTKPKETKATEASLFAPLTEEEEKRLLKNLKNAVNPTIEEAFGGTGCVEFAKKVATTIEEVYDTVIYNAKWEVLIAKAIDRFKCELSKVGGGDLSCLRQFDALQTYSNALDAAEVLKDPKKAFLKEIENNPTNTPALSTLNTVLFKRKVPTVPSLDWYKCIRAALIGLLQRLILEGILLLVQAILDKAGLDCGADFSSCDESDKDPLSPKMPETTSSPVRAAGINNSAADAARQINRAFASNISTEILKEFIRQLSDSFNNAEFKSLLSADPMLHIFDRARYITNNFFAPKVFSEQEFREFLAIVAQNYDFDALIAATIYDAVLPDESCPPELLGDPINNTLDALKTALQNKYRALGSATPSADAEDQLSDAQKQIEEEVSTFCEILGGATKTINELKSLPATMAGITEHSLTSVISGIITQLRLATFADQTKLCYLYNNTTPVDYFLRKATLNDLSTADASLAFNVVYNNYLMVRRYKNNKGEFENRNFKKKFDLVPRGLVTTLGKDKSETYNRMLRLDSFENELLQDIYEILAALTGFDYFRDLRAELFDLKRKDMTARALTLLNISRELNNPNYFYSFFEDIATALAGGGVVDFRRFPKKYPTFVKETYPNAKYVALGDNSVELINKPFDLVMTRSANGQEYVYQNNVEELVRIDVGLDQVTIEFGDFIYSRGLPKLSEPFLVNETIDYKEFINNNNQLSVAFAEDADDKQLNLFVSLVENSLKTLGIFDKLGEDSKQGITENAKLSYGLFVSSIKKQFEDNFRDSEEDVLKFFLGPHVSIPMPPEKKPSADSPYIKKLKKQNSKSGSQRFFLQSESFISSVCFEESIKDEGKKVVGKVKSEISNFYDNITDGKEYDASRIGNAIGGNQVDSSTYYEIENEISANDALWLKGDTLSKTSQEQILKSIQKVLTGGTQ